MKKHLKRGSSLLIAAILIAALPVVAFAAEDEIIDEAKVYNTQPSEENAYLSMSGITIEPKIASDEDTDYVADIEKSPAIMGNSTTTIKEEVSVAETVIPLAESPQTGLPSLLVPIGTAILSLGTILVINKKRG